MTYRGSLLRGAALAALFAVATGGSALAKPVKHHKTVTRTVVVAPAAVADNSAEIRELRAEVQELRARLDAQGQQQAAIQTQVATTQAQTAQVASDTEAVQARLDDVPATVLTTIGEIPKPAPSWADRTQISGRVYYNLSNIDQENNHRSVAPSGTAFDIKRFYLGVDHQFNDTYSANVTTDFQYASAISSTELFIKKAYLQAKYEPWLTIRLGSADLPWVPFVEDVYGYRFVENTLIDRDKFGTSADWGVHVLGSFDPIGSKTGPVVSYQISAIDGAGFKAPSGAGGAPRTDTLDIEGRVSAKWYDFTAAIGGYSGRLGKDAGATFNAPSAAVVYHDATRFDALLAYAHGPIRGGVEYFHANNWTAVTTVPTDKADGYSVFGSYQITSQFNAFARYDHVTPNKSTAPRKEDEYYNIGIDYSPVKIVDFALVYKRDSIDNGTLSTSNGTIGSATAGAKGTYDEVGLFGQFRW